MKQLFFGTYSFLLLLAIFMLPVWTTFADETYFTGTVTSYGTERFNNDNWNLLPHPKIAEFTVRDDGSAYGLTETGISFAQYNIPNDAGIRVQRFEIEDHYHYIVEGSIIDTFEDFSVQLALAYNAHVNAV